MKNNVSKIAGMLGLLLLASTAFSQQTLPQLGKSSVQDVVKAMTLQEKVDLVIGQGMFLPGMAFPGMGGGGEPTAAQKRVLGAAGTTVAIPRLGIPAIVVCDGPSGTHAFNGGKSRIYYATAWPVGTLLASSWDTAVLRKVGDAYGKEAKDFGIDVILGPGMNIHRNPLGGRNFEYYSEDPLITGTMAAAIVNGIQANGIGVSAKHFFANNNENNRNTVNVIMSERAMREIYLKGWQIMVKQSNPWTIMSSYNLVNGPYTSENPELLNTILREDLGFKGMIMTDWFSGKNVVGQQKANNHLIMPGTPQQKTAVLDAVKKGELDEKVLDQNVTEILNLVLLTPTFKGYKFTDAPPLKANAQISRWAATESMVLLKNDAKALPVEKGNSVAVFGNNALDLVAGGTGSGDVNRMYTVPLADGLFKAGYTLNANVYSTYSDYVAKELAKKPVRSLMEELMSPPSPIVEMTVSNELIQTAASQSNIAIISIGRNAGEGNDRKVVDDYTLTEKEQTLIKNVSAVFHANNKKVVVVLNVGGVVDVTKWRDNVDAILLAWQPGLEGGNAMADIISGKVNPSGKLSTTFPLSYDDEITAKNFPGREIPGTEKPALFGQKAVDAEAIYEEGIYVGYRYYSSFGKKTAYPFGYGLSYTSFKFSDLKLSAPIMNESIQATVTITNTGSVAGKEVAELYVSAPTTKLDKPSSELKAFAKTALLAPGASQTLSFTLNAADLASFQTASSSWILDAGDYTVKIGTAEETYASAGFKVAKEALVGKVHKVVVPKIAINELKNVVAKPKK
jgi:beta-glucosidase